MFLAKTIISYFKKMATYVRNFGVSAIVDMSVFTIIILIAKPELGTGSAIAITIANVVARILSSLVNFKLNKALFIGNSTSHKRSLLRYYILWASLLTLSSGTIYRLNDIFKMNEIVAKVIADMGLGIFSYQIQMRWVFSKKSHVRRKGLYFRIIRKVFRLFFKRKMMIDERIFMTENILVGHHQNFYGPISCALWLPDTVSIWAVSHLFTFKECFDMYYNYTFKKTIKLPKIVALLLSTICALLIPPLIKSAGVIPVYRNSREIMKTFNRSLELLNKGEQIMIFPDIKYNDDSCIMGEMYTGFTHLEKLYYKSNNVHIGFVPISVDKATGIITNTSTLYFSDMRSYKVEKDILANQIIENINTVIQS